MAVTTVLGVFPLFLSLFLSHHGCLATDVTLVGMGIPPHTNVNEPLPLDGVLFPVKNEYRPISVDNEGLTHYAVNRLVTAVEWQGLSTTSTLVYDSPRAAHFTFAADVSRDWIEYTTTRTTGGPVVYYFAEDCKNFLDAKPEPYAECIRKNAVVSAPWMAGPGETLTETRTGPLEPYMTITNIERFSIARPSVSAGTGVSAGVPEPSESSDGPDGGEGEDDEDAAVGVIGGDLGTVAAVVVGLIGGLTLV